MKLTLPTTEAEAREQAIAWQHYAGKHALYYSELADATAHFEQVADLFPALRDEFKENGII
jgi:hypothetical protein